MKKYILSLLVLLVSSVAMAKGPHFVLNSGSLPKLDGKRVFIEYDNSQMIVLDEDSKKEMTIEEFCRMKGDDWVRDMGKDDVDAQSTFEEKLNDKAKFTIAQDKADADYIMVVKPTKFSYGNPLAFGAGFMSNDVLGFFIGKIILKSASGSQVAEIQVNKITGTGITYTWTNQKCEVYKQVAKHLASYLKKGK